MELNTSPAVRGASLQITTCAEDPAGPSPMIVTDLGSLRIPVVYTGVALAVPAEAAAEGGAGTIFATPEDILAADEGSRDVADGGSRTMVSVSFLVLGTDSLEGALSHLDDELVSPAELICFVQNSFIMPVPRRLGAPCSFGGSVGGRRNATGRRWLAVRGRTRAATSCSGPASSSEAPGSCEGTWRPRQRGCAAAGQASNAAGGSGDTAILGDPLGALRNAGPSQVGETPGVLGVAAGAIDSAAALRDARAMLGRGTRESGSPPGRGTDEGTLSTPVGLVGGPPPGLPVPRRPPAVRAPRPEQQPQHGQQLPTATALSREGALLGRLVDLVENRSGRGESRAELFGLGAGAAGSAEDYEAAAETCAARACGGKAMLRHGLKIHPRNPRK